MSGGDVVQMGLVLLPQRRMGRGAERRFADQHLEQGTAEAVQIGPRVRGVAVEDLLRSDVIGCAHPRADDGHRRIAVVAGQPSQTQIEYLYLARRRQPQVRWFDVAVDQAALEGVLQTQRRLPHRLARLGDRPSAQLSRQALQVHAVEQLHDEERYAVADAGVGGAHQMRIFQPAQRFGLAAEALDGVLVVRQPRRQHLEGEILLEQDMAGAEDHAHATFAQRSQKLVGAELPAGRQVEFPSQRLRRIRRGLGDSRPSRPSVLGVLR